MSVARRFCRSSPALARTAVYRPFVSQAFVCQRSFAEAKKEAAAPAKKEAVAPAAAPAKKEGGLEFVVPPDWDLDYLKKFEIPAPTPEQLARAIPSPLELPGRAGQLASDLFEIASVYDVIDAIGAELQVLRQFAEKTPAFVNFLDEKAAPKKEVRTLAESLFQNASPVMKKFVARMIENNDFHRLLQVAEGYEELIRLYKKEINVTLFVAQMPTPDKLEVLKKRIAFEHLPKGANPIWEIKLKPELIKGFSVVTKDYVIDRSEAKRRKDYTDKLLEIYAKVEGAVPKISGIGPAQPAVVNEEGQLQKLASALKERHAQIKETEKAHYTAHFVDWV